MSGRDAWVATKQTLAFLALLIVVAFVMVGFVSFANAIIHSDWRALLSFASVFAVVLFWATAYRVSKTEREEKGKR